MNKTELNRLERKFQSAHNSIWNKAGKIVDEGLIPLLQQVPNGFINLQDKDCDAIYGFCVDDEMIGEQEMRIRGIRLYEGDIWLFMTILDDQVQDYTDDDMLEEFPDVYVPETHWVGLCNTDVLFVPTTMALIESITQYVR